MNRPSQSRPAFSLVELLVVIAIIGLLAALLLPAVQGVREAGRRVQCGNNLRQFGTGLTTYHELMGRFPDNGTSFSSGPGMFTVKLLPYLEQQATFDRICTGTDISSVNVWTVFANDAQLKSLVMPVFRCPSSRFPTLNDTGDAVTDYAGSSGAQATDVGLGSCSVYPGNRFDTGRDADSNNPTDLITQLSGIFSRTNGKGLIVSSKEIPDGMSNTLIMGEVRPDCSLHCRLPWWHNQKCIVTTSVPLNYQTCPAEPPGNDGTVVRNCNSYNSFITEVGFKSPHPQAVGFVFADGSVKFLKESIDPWNLDRLGCRHDGTDKGQVLQPF